VTPVPWYAAGVLSNTYVVTTGTTVVPGTTTIPLGPAPLGACPGCGRCRTCGQPAPAPAWTGPIWVAPTYPTYTVGTVGGMAS